MRGLFAGARAFNQPIGGWNTSKVTDMYMMFGSAYAFNQYIGDWDVSSVTNMGGMFDGARDYDQNMTKWCVSQFSSEPSGFSLNNSISNSNKPVWGTCPAVQDFDGPNITNILVTPTFIDISNNATKVITVSYRATDTSGVNLNYNWRPSIEIGNSTFSGTKFSLTSGNNLDGTYSASFTLASTTHPPGVYSMNNFRTQDTNGFFSDFKGNNSRALTVTNTSGADFSGPTISNIVVSPTFIDISNNATKVITVSYRATDTSGVNLNYNWRPSIEIGNSTFSGTKFTLTNGSNTDGTYSASFTLASNTHPPGVYSMNNFRTQDVNGYFSDFKGNNSRALTVTNTSGADFIGPTISNIKIVPQVANSHGGVITVSYRATDTSGVNLNYNWRPSIEIGNSTFSGTKFSLTSGNNLDGTYSASFTLASTTHPPGVYSMNNFRTQDVNGYFSDFKGNNSRAVTVTSINCSGITQSSGLDVSQTATQIDLNSDGTITAGEAIRYNITVTNSGNTTITGLDFRSDFAPSWSFIDPSQGIYSVTNLTKYVPSPNNRSDGFILPGGQAAFTHTHTITYRDFISGSLKNSLYVTAFPVCGGTVSDNSDDGDDSDGNTTNDPTIVNVVTPTLNLDSFHFYNQATGSGLTAPSGTNTKVLSSQTVSFRAVINDTTVVSPVLSIHWYSAITTTTSAFFSISKYTTRYKNSLSNSVNLWFYSWTVSPGLMTRFFNHPVGYNPNNRIIGNRIWDKPIWGSNINYCN